MEARFPPGNCPFLKKKKVDTQHNVDSATRTFRVCRPPPFFFLSSPRANSIKIYYREGSASSSKMAPRAVRSFHRFVTPAHEEMPPLRFPVYLRRSPGGRIVLWSRFRLCLRLGLLEPEQTPVSPGVLTSTGVRIGADPEDPFIGRPVHPAASAAPGYRAGVPRAIRPTW